jgi:hypothetical protein
VIEDAQRLPDCDGSWTRISLLMNRSRVPAGKGQGISQASLGQKRNPTRMSSEATSKTFFEISGCPNVQICLKNDAPPHPCSEIVRSQGTADCHKFQLPEPWVGQIDIAPILFVSSNPSIGEDDHAVGGTNPANIWESHHLAFGGGPRTYIIDGTKTTRDDGTIIKSVKYWAAIRARAQEFFPMRPVRPGIDYAITEVVHCKSVSEFGVDDAFETCTRLYMEKVLVVASAGLIVVAGATAKRWFLKDGTEAPSSPVQMLLGGRQRTVLFVPHPNERGSLKVLSKRYSAAELEELRTLVAT